MKTIGTPEHAALVEMIREKREEAGLTQMDVALALGEQQSFVSRLESKQRRIDVIEFLALSKVIGFDPAALLKKIGAAAL